MLTKLSSLQAGTLGELLTVAKLNTLGHAAYISPECVRSRCHSRRRSSAKVD